MTNAEKFEEVFGLKIDEYPASICFTIDQSICPEHNCDDCPAFKFWDREYKKPVKTCTDDKGEENENLCCDRG